MAGLFLLWLLFLELQMSSTDSKEDTAICTWINPFQFPYKYYRAGHLIIGAMASQFGCILQATSFSEHPRSMFVDDITATPKNYQHTLSLVFAVKEINENPKILPNISLGFHIYDSCTDAKVTQQNTINLLSSWKKMVPNFNCDQQNNLIAVIGAIESDFSLLMATLLGLYKIPQIAYCVFAPVMDVKTQLPSFYRMVPNEAHLYKGIIQLLLHFQWMWVGMITTDDDVGETFAQTLMQMLYQHGVCAAFHEKTPLASNTLQTMHSFESIQIKAESINNSKVKVFIVNAEPQTRSLLIWFIYIHAVLGGISRMPIGKVWIMTAQWDFSSESMHRGFDIQVFDGALSFAIHSKEVPKFPNFLRLLHPHSEEGDDFIRMIWEKAFGCFFSDSHEIRESSDGCTGQEKLDDLPGLMFEMSMTGQSYSIYNAVHAIAHALHKMLTSKPKHGTILDRDRFNPTDVHAWQLHHMLRSVSFNNSVGDRVFLDENRELEAGFDIINWVTFPNRSFLRVKVGKMDPHSLPEFIIHEEAITWHNTFNQVLPIAVCNDHCYPGYSRKKKEGEPSCCYDCAPCPGGKVSDQKGSVGTRVLVVGHSIPFWARKRAISGGFGTQLGHGRSVCVEWETKRGMRWGQFLPLMLEYLATNPAAQVIVLHLGGNDLACRSTLSLRIHAKSDLARLCRWVPGLRIMWSNLLPRRVWRDARSPVAVDRARKKFNEYMGRVVRTAGGAVIRHNNIRFEDVALFRSDGVHLSDQGSDMYLFNLQRAISSSLLEWAMGGKR